MNKVNQQLPNEILPRSSSLSRIILSLVFSSMVFALANIAANLYLRNFPRNRGYWLIKHKWSMLLNLKQPVDWLVLGDSSCNQGVIPKVLEAELSGKAVNLCTIANALVLNDAWMLNKYIKKYGAPKNVVLVHVYDIWQRKINWNITGQTPLRWGYWQRLNPQLKLSVSEQQTLFLNQYVPLYSQNISIVNILENSDTWFKNKEYLITEDGFRIDNKADSINVERDKNGHIKLIQRNPQFVLSSINQKSLLAMIELAQKYNINIYLSNSPLYKGLYSDSDFQTYYNQVQQKFKSISDRSNNFHYITAKPITFDKEEMENADHIIAPVAESYTKQLAQNIRQLQESQKVTE